MSEVSNLYRSSESIYRVGSKQQSDKEKNGDVKHIVFKDGEPVYSEIIKVNREKKERLPKLKRERSTRRISTRSSGRQSTGSGADALSNKRKKLSSRLKKAINLSETLWSDRTGIWISYQGNQQFLVKQFSEKNQLLSKRLMSQTEILEGSIPGILDTGWKVL